MQKKIWILVLVLSVGLLSFHRPVNDNYFDIVKNIEIFAKTYKLANTHYAEEIDPNELMKIGIDAMMESLDPYTIYYSESDIEKFRYQRQDAGVGLGAELKLVDGRITITGAQESSPAIQSGLMIGDQIIELDGESVSGRSPSEFNELFETYPGDFINLTVRRLGTSEMVRVEFQRDKITPPKNVPHSQLIDGDIAYVALSTFTAAASKNVEKAILKVKEENPDIKGIILDLRDNGGGLLREAVSLSNLFIPSGKLVVSTRGKIESNDRIYNTKSAPLDVEIPLAVLVNGNSASASEIVSGVIQDYDRGVLIGRQTYGKGLVQNFQDIAYNSRMKITISKYYIPSGRCIQSVRYKNGEPVDIPDSLRTTFYTTSGRPVLDGGGVRPDVAIPETDRNEFFEALEEKHMIHKYVNYFISQNDSIQDILGFEFNDMDGFYAFLDREGFEYDLKLDEAVTQYGQNGYSEEYMKNLTSLSENIKKDQENSAREEIRRTLEVEIIKRYHFRKGEILKTLDKDPYILEALEVLRDSERYQEILSI